VEVSGAALAGGRDIGGSVHPVSRTGVAGFRQSHQMSIGTLLLVVLILIVVGALPSWPYSSGWGYGPSGIAGLVVIVLIVLLLMGRL
jgi:hypothetical protein